VRYDLRYRDPTGRAQEKAFRRKKDAERFALPLTLVQMLGAHGGGGADQA
jgi:hypothetical protein